MREEQKSGNLLRLTCKLNANHFNTGPKFLGFTVNKEKTAQRAWTAGRFSYYYFRNFHLTILC